MRNAALVIVWSVAISMSAGACEGGSSESDPTCLDAVQNGDETGEDCGGPVCPGCPDGTGCVGDGDCESGFCSPTTNACATPDCSDGDQNGDETGEDCGGSVCPGCPDGTGCVDGGDCESGFCHPTTNACATPDCFDGLQNLDETGVDCGGLDCPGCPDGTDCVGHGDCQSGFCEPAGSTCETPIPVVEFTLATSSAAEADGTLSVSLTLSTPVPTGSEVTVPVSVFGGSAMTPDDFTLDATQVVFPAGSVDGTQQAVTLSLVTDPWVEGDEGVDLSLGVPTGGAELGAVTVHSATITDSTLPNPYAGNYTGTYDGICTGVGAVTGTLQFDVAPDGTLTGSFAGDDSGPMNGTVDATGLLAATGQGALSGACSFDGQIDTAGNVTGTWNCPALTCTGAFAAL